MTDKIIDSVKVGPIDFSLKLMQQTDESKEFFSGKINMSAEQIFLNVNLGPESQKVALWHEVLHAILWQGGFDNQNEGIIQSMAFGIVSALKENEILRMNE